MGWRYIGRTLAKFVFAGLILCPPVPQSTGAAGVTIITHGFNSDANGWVTGMADAVPADSAFPGTNFTTYKMTVTYSGGYLFSVSRTNGSAPAATDSGEIIIKLDWSQLAGDLNPFDTKSSFSTYQVAWAVGAGVAADERHFRTERPSARGISNSFGRPQSRRLVDESNCAASLGTNGIWVDHLTTLDPHPAEQRRQFRIFPATITDASAKQHVR